MEWVFGHRWAPVVFATVMLFVGRHAVAADVRSAAAAVSGDVKRVQGLLEDAVGWPAGSPVTLPDPTSQHQLQQRGPVGGVAVRPTGFDPDIMWHRRNYVDVSIHARGWRSREASGSGKTTRTPGRGSWSDRLGSWKLPEICRSVALESNYSIERGDL